MGFSVPRYIPERVERSGPGSFKMNQWTGQNAKPGDDVPGIYKAAQPSAPGGGSPGGFGGGMPTIPKVGQPGTGGQGGGAPGPATPVNNTFTNTAAQNPDMQAALEEYRRRIEEQRGREGQVDPLLMEQVKNLRERMSADQTQRATERAGSNIRDFAAGQRSSADEMAARMGRPQGFRNAAIDEAAQRAQAKAAADIQMGEQQRLDNLTLGGQGIMSAPAQLQLQREAGVTGLIGGLMNQAGAGANLGLQQQQLGLQQWQSQQQMELERQRLAQQQQQAQQELMLRMLQSSGYY